MNNLAYSKQKSEDVAPQVEEILRKDLGMNVAVPYSVAEAGGAVGAIESIAQDAAKFFFGGNETLLFKLKFDIASPRTASIQVNINRQGIGCHAGSVTFSTFINKTIGGEVSLEEPKTFGTSKFVGDAGATAKLNGNKDLLKAADKFARVKSNMGGVELKMNRYFKLIPASNGTHIVVITFPRALSMGFSATTDAKDFFTLAAMIEAAL